MRPLYASESLSVHPAIVSAELSPGPSLERRSMGSVVIFKDIRHARGAFLGEICLRTFFFSYVKLIPQPWRRNRGMIRCAPSDKCIQRDRPKSNELPSATTGTRKTAPPTGEHQDTHREVNEAKAADAAGKQGVVTLLRSHGERGGLGDGGRRYHRWTGAAEHVYLEG